MTDLLDSIGGIADTAADFLLPEPTPGGQGFSPGNILSSIGTGLTDTLREGPLGLFEAGRQALYGGGSAKERLFLGGMAALGAGLGAREMHRAFSAQRMPTVAPAFRPARAPGFEQLEAVGLQRRFLAQTDDAVEYSKLAPHLSGYQHQILGGRTPENIAIGLTKGNTDPIAVGNAVAFLNQYTTVAGGMDHAQVDLARFQGAAGILKGPGADKIRKTWGRLEAGELVEGPEFDELATAVKSVSDLTNSIISPDLTFGPFGRVTEIHRTKGGEFLPVAEYPIDLSPERIADETNRKRTLERVNWTDPSVARQMEANLRHLARIGVEDYKLTSQGGASRFSEPLDLGPEWYYRSHDDIAREFNVADTDPEYPSLVAGVSFLSEAQDWSTNIEKAHRLYEVSKAAEIADPDFVDWLRHKTRADTGVHLYRGKKGKQHSATFNRILADSKDRGLKVADKDLKKVLRMWSGLESPESVFRSTDATKQKNFYLNLLNPDLTYPTTIDRHAFDALLGLDFGNTDRPINLSVSGGRQFYDVAQAVYQKVAEDLGFEAPHELQAVVWETWKRFKGSEGLAQQRGGWAKGDPMMLPDLLKSEPGLPARNFFFEALNGRGDAMPLNLKMDGVERIPLDVVEADLSVSGIGNVPLPDGSVGVVMDLNEYSSTIARTSAPFVRGKDGAYRWGPVYPERVSSLDSHSRQLARDPLSQSDTYLSQELEQVGGHPLAVPGQQILVEHEDGLKIAARRWGKAYPFARNKRSAPQRIHERLDPGSIPAERWMDPSESPLVTHAWATISSSMNPIQVAHAKTKGWKGARGKEWAYDQGTQRNALRREILNRGFHLQEVDGFYGGHEKGFLVIGMTKEEALEIGEKFGQSRVLTDQGFLYNRDAGFVMQAAAAGRIDRTAKVEFYPDSPGDEYTRFVVNGEEVYFSARGANGDLTDMEEIFDMSTITPRLDENVAVTRLMVRPGVDIAEAANNLAARRGVKRVSVYSDQATIGEGWQRSYERLVTDGPRTRVVRYADGPLGDPYGGHVFSKDASQYPWDPTPASNVEGPRNPDAIGYGYLAEEDRLVAITDELEFQSGAYAALVKGKYVEALDEQDLIPAVKAWRRALADGNPDARTAKLRTSSGTFDFPTDAALNPKQPPIVAKVKSGQVLERIRNDRARDVRGIAVDGGYRVGNEIEEISDEWFGEIDTTLGWFQERHADALDRWGLHKISVSPGLSGDADQFALLQWQKSGAIVLSKTYWSDPKVFTESLKYQRENTGALSPRVPSTPGGVVAHELGHVLHGAIRLAEGGLDSKKTPFDDAVIELLGGKKNWKETAKREISLTAGEEPSELVAEAVSEVVFGNPSPISQAVYDLVVKTLDDSLAFRRGMAMPIPARDPSGMIADAGFRRVDAREFHAAVEAAQQVEKNGRKVGETVYRYPVTEYRDMQTFLSEDGRTGFAVKSDGDLVSVFNVGRRGRGESAVNAGIAAGATKLDAFDEDGFLPQKYAKFGFEEVGREPWDPEYAPEGWRGGKPDVVYMQRS